MTDKMIHKVGDIVQTTYGYKYLILEEKDGRYTIQGVTSSGDSYLLTIGLRTLNGLDPVPTVPKLLMKL